MVTVEQPVFPFGHCALTDARTTPGKAIGGSGGCKKLATVGRVRKRLCSTLC
jgi:hypothetical protein